MKQVFLSTTPEFLKRLIQLQPGTWSIQSILIQSESMEIASAFDIDIAISFRALPMQEDVTYHHRRAYTLIIVDVLQ